QALEGGRMFYREYLSPINEAPLNVKLQLNIHISTLSDTFVTMVGSQYIYKDGAWSPSGAYAPQKFRVLDDYVTKDLITAINDQTGKNFKLYSGANWASELEVLVNWFPLYFKMDESEVLSFNGGPGYQIQSVDDGDFEFNPVDTFDRLNLNNLMSNAGKAVVIAYGLTQTSGLPAFSLIRNSQYVLGKMVEYNETSDWYDPIENAIVFAWFQGWPRPMTTISQEDGSYAFYDFPSMSFYGGVLLGTKPGLIKVDGFVINATTGNVLYAATKGIHKWTTVVLGRGWTYEELDMGFLVLFKAGTLVLFDNHHPESLTRLLFTKVIRADTQISPDSYGYHRLELTHQRGKTNWGIGESFGFPYTFGMQTVYVPPDLPIAVLWDDPFEEPPVSIVANTSDDNPSGNGFTLKAGEQYVVYKTALQCAIDILRFSEQYVTNLDSVAIPTVDIVAKRMSAEETIDLALEKFGNNSYRESYALQIKAWVQARQPYLDSRNIFVDVISLAPYFAILLLPFVFLTERLIFKFDDGKKRLMTLLIIFLVMYGFFSVLHPSFALASNPVIIVIAFLVVILTLPSLYMLFNYAAGSLKRMRQKTIGRHDVQVSRGSAITLAFQTGTQNMSKRKGRTILMILTIILVTVGVITFSSLESISIIKLRTENIIPPYEGITVDIIGTYLVSNHLGFNIRDFLAGSYNDTADILVTGNMYNEWPGDNSNKALFNLTYGENEFGIYAFTALSTDISPHWVEEGFDQGKIAGRWFNPGEIYSLVLPEKLTDKMNISIGDTVGLLGRNLTLIGIIETEYYEQIVALNGQSIKPKDYRIPSAPPTLTEITGIISLDYAIMYNPFILSVSVIPNNSSQIPEIASEMFSTLKQTNIIGGLNNQTIFYSRSTSTTAFGWQMQLIPIVIAAVMILNLMLGSVKEREKDLFVYSAIGLSPFHIAFMFLAETIIYGLVGGVIGYVASMVTPTLFELATGFVIPMNISSSFVVIALGIIILVTVLSSLYPMYSASKIVTPSLERSWKLPTSPEKGKWKIPLPIVIPSKEDLRKLLKFLDEFVMAQEGEIGVFSPEGDIKISESAEEGESEVILFNVNTRLAPYDQGIVHIFTLHFEYNKSENRWGVTVLLELLSGETALWERVVRGFIDEFRRQFIIWRTFSDEDKIRYK
ncbi:MAG: ABC transporter permease, partial [Candidatus Kariarchaeaceae archaeon]